MFIKKHKLPKELSYPLQTSDITKFLNTDSLNIYYTYLYENYKKEKNIYISLISYTIYSAKITSELDYTSVLRIYSVPSRLRKPFRQALNTSVLSIIKDWQNKGHSLAVYYRNNGLFCGGLYVEKDRYRDKAKVVYHDKNFNVDDEIKELT